LAPYAYLAHSQLRRFSVISHRPFDIRTVMDRVGNLPTSVLCEPKNRYLQADLRRWVALYYVPFQTHPHVLELDARRLLRATMWAASRGPVDRLVGALYDSLWGDPQPLQTPADIGRILARAGINCPAAAVEMDAAHWHEALGRATAEAAERGVFGAPCMFVGDEMFFGNDRLDFVRAELGRAA
jgi:2-hydroxychromene-2-carboxylate isomerase